MKRITIAMRVWVPLPAVNNNRIYDPSPLPNGVIRWDYIGAYNADGGATTLWIGLWAENTGWGLYSVINPVASQILSNIVPIVATSDYVPYAATYGATIGHRLILVAIGELLDAVSG